ncbi:MAG TPA: MYXO-CTERM sorting domain-containing protein [Kofleriaceae bacterium]|nr:MYXO-CTERM sorting domain-containing protein [Kofleriaceae bacterium]
MERSFGLAFTTLTIFAPPAHAAHPKQAVKPEGNASPFEFVASALTADPVHPTAAARARGYALARQVLPARATSPAAEQRAQSRVIYLNRDGVLLRPGDNDSTRQISSVVSVPTEIAGWDVDDDTWSDTVACIQDLYAAFDVTVTDEDPGATPHIEAVFGGSPGDVGLPDNVAGVSPFTTDCAIIEGSIAFAFTDVLPDDPQTVCEVIGQEIAHSFGLDHEMLASDPMTYLAYDGNRRFRDRMVSCGEYADRPCGVNGSTCRARQNSVALLTERLGARGASATSTGDGSDPPPAGSGMTGGCTAAGGPPSGAIALALLGLLRRRRRR